MNILRNVGWTCLAATVLGIATLRWGLRQLRVLDQPDTYDLFPDGDPR